jgi:hypothetical protein
MCHNVGFTSWYCVDDNFVQDHVFTRLAAELGQTSQCLEGKRLFFIVRGIRAEKNGLANGVVRLSHNSAFFNDIRRMK